MRWVFIGVTARPGGGRQPDSDGQTSLLCVPQSGLFTAALRRLVSISTLGQAKGTSPAHKAQYTGQRRTLDALRRRSARSGSQGINPPPIPSPVHQLPSCTLKHCHFSTYHLSSKKLDCEIHRGLTGHCAARHT